MNLKEEVLNMKKEVNEVKEQSFALEILSDYKKANKRQFIIILVILSLWFLTIGYLIYVLNDIGSTTDTIDIQDVETIDSSHIKIGDDKWEELE
jgi:uncharacterized membrane protein